MSFDYIELLDRVFFTMKWKGVSQAAVSEKLDIPESTIANFFSGRSRVNFEFVYDVAKMCGVEPGWLMSGEGPIEGWTIENQRLFEAVKAVPAMKRASLLKLAVDPSLLESALLSDETESLLAEVQGVLGGLNRVRQGIAPIESALSQPLTLATNDLSRLYVLLRNQKSTVRKALETVAASEESGEVLAARP